MQKLLKLQEVEVKAGEEQKGDIIGGSSGEALTPPGKGTTFTQINSVLVQVYLDRSSLIGLLYQKLFGCWVRHLKKRMMKQRS